MIRVLHCVTHGLAVAGPPSSCVAITNSGQRIFRILFPCLEITDERCGMKFIISTPGEITKFDMPPACIAAEKSYVAALTNECFDVRAHLVAPVLIMTNAEQKSIRLDEITLLVQIEVGTVIHLITVFLEPGDEGNVPVCECLAWRSFIVGIKTVRKIVADREMWNSAARAAARPMNADLIDSRFRDRVCEPLPHIEVATARVVVRVISCQRQLVKNRRVLSWRTALQHKQRLRISTVCADLFAIVNWFTLLIRFDQIGNVGAAGPIVGNWKIVTRPAPVVVMAELREVMTDLRIETSHLNEFSALPIEVNTKTLVWVVGRDMKPELLFRTYGGAIRIALYHCSLSIAF